MSVNQRKKSGIYPFYASFKVTNKCSLTCNFCDVWKEKTPVLDTKGMKKILDNLGNSSIFLVSLEGGDPLLRPDLKEILEHASTKPFLLFFTTNGALLDKVDMDTYGKYIDFLHISIDNAHENIYEHQKNYRNLLNRLEDFKKWAPVCVQTVVRDKKEDFDSLDYIVDKAYHRKARVVIMPSVDLDNADYTHSDLEGFKQRFVDKVRALKKKYNGVITTPESYLKRLQQSHACSTSSIIIDCDGTLFYPCRILKTRTVNLAETSLMKFVESEQAERYREVMKKCEKNCGWYQYYSTDSYFTFSPAEFLESIKPYIFKQKGDTWLKQKVRSLANMDKFFD